MGSRSAASPWVVANDGSGFRWRRVDGEVIAEWAGVLTLRIDSAGDVTPSVAPDAPPELAEKLMHTGAVAFVRALRQEISLHGSAVADSGTAFVCLGEKGSGKSTAARELCETGRFELLADDVVALDHLNDRWCVAPTDSSHWLESGEESRKRAVAARRVAPRPTVLACLVMLRFDDRLTGLAARQLRGSEVYEALSQAVLRFEAADALRLKELDLLCSIARQARTYELARPRSIGFVQTTGALMQLIEGGA